MCDYKKTFFDNLHLILAGIERQKFGICYSFIEHFYNFYLEKPELFDIDTEIVMTSLSMLKAGLDADEGWSKNKEQIFNRALYTSGIVGFFARLISPINPQHQENLKVLQKCFDSIEYDWEYMYKDYKIYF